MNDALIRVVYVSQNTIQGNDEQVSAEIEHILDAARSLNAQSGITGALMFNRNLFAQVLEGPMDKVEETFERIQCDQRHSDVSLLACEPISERSFEQWSMAYIGSQAQVPGNLLNLADSTGFDSALIDGNMVHEALHALLIDADGTHHAN